MSACKTFDLVTKFQTGSLAELNTKQKSQFCYKTFCANFEHKQQHMMTNSAGKVLMKEDLIEFHRRFDRHWSILHIFDTLETWEM